MPGEQISENNEASYTRRLRIGRLAARRCRDRLPRPGRHLHRGRARRGDRPAATSSRCGRRPIHDAILAVEHGEADRALVPFENSIEGSVRGTLDTLAFEAQAVTIVGEHDYRGAGPPDRPRGSRARRGSRRCSPTPSRWPSARASCASSFPEVELRSVSSTAAAVRMVSESERPWAAIGARAAAELYGCELLARGSRTRRQRHPLRLDRPGRHRAGRRGRVEDLAGLLRARRRPPRRPGRRPAASSPAAAINLTRIESRPLRQGLGRYMFFCDLEGAEDDPTVAEAIARCATRPSRCGSSAPTRWADGRPSHPRSR